MISLNTNITDLILLNSLNASTGGINKSIERLTTGYKLNHAKDNAANLSIVTNLSTKINSLLKVRNNTEDGISLLLTAQGALENIQDQLSRLRALSIQAANGNYGEQSLSAMQAEADAIIENIKQIRENTEFNGLKLFETPQNESLAQSASTVANLSNAPVKMRAAARSAAAPMALSDGDTIDGAVDFAASETKTINIDGVNYTVRNKEGVAKTLSYTKDKTTGELTLYINNMEVHGEENKSHNLIIYGSYNAIYGGNLNDSIHITGVNNSSSTNNYIYGGDGDDILTSDCREIYMYGQNGNDTFNINYINTYAYGGAGDDTFNVNTPDSGSVEVYGQDGEDKFYINTPTVMAYVDGGAGTNYAENKSINATLINVPNANAYVVEFKARETKNLTINGLNYEVTNNRAIDTSFLYAINSDGAIEIKSQYYTVKGDKNQQHNIKLAVPSITYYAGNQGDIVVASALSDTIYGGNGNDNISVISFTNVFAGAGDNTITISGNRNVIKTGNGNNTVILNYLDAGLSAFEFGDGNNTIQNAQRMSHSSISAGSGTNTFVGGTPRDSLICGFGSADNASVFIPPTSGSSVLKVNGVDYEVSKKSVNATNLLYSYNSVTGEVAFAASGLSIKGATDVAHNVIIQGGKDLVFYGGDCDDIIVNYAYNLEAYGMGGNDTITSISFTDCRIYGGAGNDNITASGAHVSGEAGDDTITIVGGGSIYSIDGGEGNDTYNIESTVRISDNYGNNIYNISGDNMSVSGGSGDDTFYINGNNNVIQGAGGNDYIVVDGNNNTIDGGTGTNYYVDNGVNTTLMNVNKDPNSGILTFTYVGEVKTFEMDGRTYTVTNQNADGTSPASNQLRYSFNPNTGVITLDGSDLTVESELNSAHKLNIRGDNNTVNGGNLADVITLERGTNNIVNALGGNDTIHMNSADNSANGGDGNDTININTTSDKLISGGNGDDVINVNSSNNTNIDGGEGNNRIILTGSNNTVELGNGNNTVNVRSNDNVVNAGDGDNTLSVSGSSNIITAGNGNNKVGVDGTSNIVEVGYTEKAIDIYGQGNTVIKKEGDGSININGSNNTYQSENGNEEITVKGDGNTVDSGSGDTDIVVQGNRNAVSSSAGNNDIKIRGDENIYQGGSDIDNISVTGNSNQLNGGEGNDFFIVSRGNNNSIDGEEGNRNTMINNGKNTTYINVIDITPRPFELSLKVDLGTSENSFINVSISFNLFDFYLDFSSPDSLEENLEKIDELNLQVEEQLLNIGSVLDRLTTVLESQSIQMENLISTRSTLRDADVVKESSNLIKYEILQQASATLMSTTRNINMEFILGILTH